MKDRDIAMGVVKAANSRKNADFGGLEKTNKAFSYIVICLEGVHRPRDDRT